MWKKYGRDGKATDDTIIWRMRFTYCMIKATDTHPEHVIWRMRFTRWFKYDRD